MRFCTDFEHTAYEINVGHHTQRYVTMFEYVVVWVLIRFISLHALM